MLFIHQDHLSVSCSVRDIGCKNNKTEKNNYNQDNPQTLLAFSCKCYVLFVEGSVQDGNVFTIQYNAIPLNTTDFMTKLNSN